MIDYHTFARSKPCMSSMDSLSLRLPPLSSIRAPSPSGCAKSASGRDNRRHEPVNSIRLSSRLSTCWKSTPIVPHKSCSTYASRALRAATPRSKPTCELSAPAPAGFSQTCLCSGRVRPSRLGLVRLGRSNWQTRRRLSFFVMVLCYSRRMYVEFTVSQTMEHFLACHQHAFEKFEGAHRRSWSTISNPPCSSALWVSARIQSQVCRLCQAQWLSHRAV